MKIEVTFDEDDVEKMLIEKVQSMGVQANKCLIKAAYGRFDKAEVWYEEPTESPPVAPPAPEHPPEPGVIAADDPTDPF